MAREGGHTDIRITPPSSIATPISAVGPTKRVLVVDDLPMITDVFKRAVRRLRQQNVDITTEINSARAVEILQRERFDLVVSDFRMREVDGIQVLRAARAANPAGRRILMSGYHDIPTTAKELLEADLDGYLQKPFEFADLVTLLQRALSDDPNAMGDIRERARSLERTALKVAPGPDASIHGASALGAPNGAP